MAAARWFQAPAVDVRRGWEAQWADIADDVWETVAALRTAAPFPVAPGPEDAPPSAPASPVGDGSAAGLLSGSGIELGEPVAAMSAARISRNLSSSGMTPTDAGSRGALGTPGISLSQTIKATPRRLVATSDPVLGPGTLRKRSCAYSRVWRLVSDHRWAFLDNRPVRARDFVLQRLRLEFRRLVTSAFAVLYDLGCDPEDDEVGAHASAALLGSTRASYADITEHPTPGHHHVWNGLPAATTPLKRHWRDLEQDDERESAAGCGVIALGAHERVHALAWALDVLLTLRLHCHALLQRLRHQFRALGPDAAPNGTLDRLLWDEVARAFAARRFYAVLARAVSTLEQPARVVASFRAASPSGADPSATVLSAMVTVVRWCMDCGFDLMVTTFARELKTRWAEAASEVVDSMSPELGPLATARQLLAVLQHCDGLLSQLGAAIGEVHVAIVREEIAHAVLSRDTVGLVLRLLYRVAIHPEEAAVLAAQNDEEDTGNSLDGFDPIAADDAAASREALIAEATALLQDVLARGARLPHVVDELAAAIAEGLHEAVGGGKGSSRDAGGSGSTAGAPHTESVTPVLHLLDAVSAARKALHLDPSVSLQRSSLRRGRNRATGRAPASGNASAVVVEMTPTTLCCATALGEAISRVVGSFSEHFERVLADVLFGGATGMALEDIGDDLLAVCERVHGTDRLVQYCKAVIARRLMRPRDGAGPTLALPSDDALTQSATRPLVSLHSGPLSAGRSSLPTGSVDLSHTGEGAVANIDEVHGALRRWLAPEAVAPLTALVAELGVAYVLDSETIASPFDRSTNDLLECVGDTPDGTDAEGDAEDNRDDVVTVAHASAIRPVAEGAESSSRPPFCVRCRCLAAALWQPQIPSVALSAGPAGFVDVKALATNGLVKCTEWVERQYAVSFPRRRLAWPALAGEVTLLFRPKRQYPTWDAFATPIEADAKEQPLSEPSTPFGRRSAGSRSGGTRLICVPLVAAVLLCFNEIPEASVEQLCRAAGPVAPSVVLRLLEWLRGMGLVRAITDTGRYAPVDEIASGPVRKINLANIAWMKAPEGDDAALVSPASSSGDSSTGASAAQSKAVEKGLLASRQRTAEAAVVRLLKEHRAMDATTCFAETAKALRSHFALDARVFKAALEQLIAREYVARDESVKPPLLTYIA